MSEPNEIKTEKTKEKSKFIEWLNNNIDELREMFVDNHLTEWNKWTSEIYENSKDLNRSLSDILGEYLNEIPLNLTNEQARKEIMKWKQNL